MADSDADWHGRNPAISDASDVIRVLERRSPEPLTAGDVADACDCGRRTALRRLQELAGIDTNDDQRLFDADPRVESKQVGGRSRVFWFDTDSDTRTRDASTPDQTSEQDTVADHREIAQAPPEPVVNDHDLDVPETEAAQPTTRDLQDLAAAVDRNAIRDNLPGSGDRLEARVDAILDLYQYLRNQAGQIRTTSELKNRVDADAVGYKSVDSFWSNAVKANSDLDRKNALTALPAVEELGNGRYRYTPDP